MENFSILTDIQNKNNIKEYSIKKNNKIYKFLIRKSKQENNIIIKTVDYKIKLGLKELIKITKIYLESIEDAYNLILNLFDSNKVSIKDSLNEKILIISLKIYNNIKNKEDDILINIPIRNNKKEKLLNDIYYKYNILQNNFIKLEEENKKNNELLNLLINEIKNIKKENKLVKNEINKLKSFCNYKNNKSNNENNDSNNNNIDIIEDLEFKLFKQKNNNSTQINIDNDQNSPNLINSSITLIKDAYGYYEMDNTFIVLNSLCGITHIIYVKENNSIVNYNLTQQNMISEIKNAHEKMITSFNYYLDKINKIDIIMSISAEDCNIKLWNLRNMECIAYIRNIYEAGCLFSSCFLNENNKIFLVTSNCAETSGPIKIINFNGELIKQINNSSEETFFINEYYEKNENKIYIITGNKGYSKSYDYYENKLYKKYYDKDLSKGHDSILISEYEEDNEIVFLIDSCQNGFISIWNFHFGLLLHKINIGFNYLEGICLWNQKYLFAGGGDNSIKLIEIKNGLIIKSLTGHKENVLSIKKIDNEKYGECLVSQGNDGIIKLWISNSN